MGMIEERVTMPVADVDWNDDRDVVLTIWTKNYRCRSRVLTRAQARELAETLIAVADTAESASEARTVSNQAVFDTASISPDCRDGKHMACVGDAWDHAADHATSCDCPCHWDTITEEQAA